MGKILGDKPGASDIETQQGNQNQERPPPPYLTQKPSYHRPQYLPPPYPTQPQQPLNSSESPLNPQFPPQSHHVQAPSRTLQVDFTSWKSTHIRVTEAGPAATVLWTVDLKLRKPHLSFRLGENERASTTGGDTVIATANLRSIPPRIEASIHGHAMTFRIKSGLRGYKATFEPSVRLRNASLTWKSKSAWKCLDLECVDEENVPVAQFIANTSWSMSKVGRLEVFGPAASNSILLDEIAVTGIAMAYYTFTQHTAAAA